MLKFNIAGWCRGQHCSLVRSRRKFESFSRTHNGINRYIIVASVLAVLLLSSPGFVIRADDLPGGDGASPQSSESLTLDQEQFNLISDKLELQNSLLMLGLGWLGGLIAGKELFKLWTV